MNPLTKVKLINELNEREVQLGVADKVSWHSEYKDSAWIFVGGLPHELTERDIICVFSQYGEIVNINLVRDKKTGKSKGFCFLCYEDQRSTTLAVDNFNGIKIKGRTLCVNHVSNYRVPRESEVEDDVTRELHEKGCGANTPPPSSSEESEDDKHIKKHKKDKKEKKKRKTDQEKTDHKVQAEQAPSSMSPRSKTIKDKNEFGPKKHGSSTSELRGLNPERGRSTAQALLKLGLPAKVEQRTPRGSQNRRNTSMSTSLQVGGRLEKKSPRRERGGKAQQQSEGQSHRSRNQSLDKFHQHKKLPCSGSGNHSIPGTTDYH